MKPPCDEAVIQAQGASSPCHGSTGTWVLAATILASSMAFIDSTIVNVALPALQTNLGASVVGVQWVIESYGLTLSALILAGGAMGDAFGRRRMFLLGVAVFAVASAACGFARDIHQLIFARAIQGIGAAFLVPGSLALISASFEEKDRGRAIGTWSGSTAITTAIGPVIGGWLIQHWSWRWAFFLNVPIAAAVIVIALWRVPESKSRHRQPIDWRGAAAVTLGLTGLVFGFLESANLGWTNPWIVGSLTVGSVSIAGFLYIEATMPSPMVPLTLFRSRAFSGANLLTFFLYATLGIFFFLLPLDLIQVQRYTATQAGAAILPMILLVFLLSRWSGGLVDRYGPRLPLIVGPLVVACAFLLLALPLAGGSYWKVFFPALTVLGFGMALSVAPLTTVVMQSIEPDRAGTASGINNAVARVSGLLAIAILGVVMVAAFGEHLHHSLTEVSIGPQARTELESNQNKLAALSAPTGVNPATAAMVDASISAAFLYGFRLIMWICVALALASSAVAWQMIGTHPLPETVSGARNSLSSPIPSGMRVQRQDPSI